MQILNMLEGWISAPLKAFLERSAFDIHNEDERHAYQVEGYMRMQMGQITQSQAEARGIHVKPMTLLTDVASGTMISLDRKNNTTLHDGTPIINGGNDRRSVISVGSNSSIISQGLQQANDAVGQIAEVTQRVQSRLPSGQLIRVDERHKIDADAMYMWELNASHLIFDVCDGYHGRVYQGSNVPMPLHNGCNCMLRRLGGPDNHLTNGLAPVASALGIETRVWQNVERFTRGINNFNSQLNTVQSNIQTSQDTLSQYMGVAATAASFMVNPQAFLVDTAITMVVDHIREQAVDHARQRLQQEILSRTGLSVDTTSMATLQSSGLNAVINSDPRLQQRHAQFQALTNMYNQFSNVTTLSGGIDFVQSIGDTLDSFNINSAPLRQAINSPLLRATSSRAVMLQGGVRGLTRLALILI